MKKVLIYAYLEGNLGDDLMVYILCRRFPEIRFEILAHASYRQTFAGLKNLKVYALESKTVACWNTVLNRVKHGQEDFFKRLVRKAWGVVHVGGSVYTQHEQYEISYMIDTVLRDTSRHMFVCGANFGPYKEQSYYENYHALLKRYDGVCFRDRYSCQLFQDLPNVRFAPDIVFQYPSCVEEKPVRQKRQVLISVLQMENKGGTFSICRYAKSYVGFIVKVTEKYIAQGYTVSLVSFCKAQGDAKAALEIREAVAPEKRAQVKLCTYENNLEEILLQFDEAEIVVGTRFHSIILGWVKKKKVLPIVYDQKTLHVLQDTGCQAYVELEDLERLQDKEIDSLLAGIGRLEEGLTAQLIQESRKQFASFAQCYGAAEQ